jgi:23S rRNA (uracil1939-C5)-methyltransferase
MAEFLSQGRRLLDLELDGLGRLGEALSEFEGKRVFVFGGLSGEKVVAEVLRERRDYISTRVIKVIKASPFRIQAPCSFFGECTGCQWQHVQYAHQLEMKQRIVLDSLARIGGINNVSVLPTIPSPLELGYRNHARFTVSKEGGRLGFIHRETHRHVDIDHCLLMTPWINGALSRLQGRVAETTQVSARYGVNTGEGMLQPKLRNPDIPLETGQKHYSEIMLGHKFRISSPSFFQVNTEQAEIISRLIKEALCLNGNQVIVDAYAGVATFAVLLANDVKKAIAIEESAAAISDAELNVVGISNVELRCGRAEDILQDLAIQEQIDAVILDPSRKGCLPGTLDALIKAAPERIAYLSCDPETLARDLKVLIDGPFDIQSIQPIDMFPQTHHTECLAILVLDRNKQASIVKRHQLILASSSPRREAICERLGLKFTVDAGLWVEKAEESVQTIGLDVIEIAIARSLAKASASAIRLTEGTIIGMDTVVEMGGAVFGKPGNRKTAINTLERLRGQEHRVITAVSLIDGMSREVLSRHQVTQVIMRNYTDEEIRAYIRSGEFHDKAGSYAIQDHDFSPVEGIMGCYLNVVGFPVCLVLKMLREFGISSEILRYGDWPEIDRCPDCVEYMSQ